MNLKGLLFFVAKAKIAFHFTAVGGRKSLSIVEGRALSLGTGFSDLHIGEVVWFKTKGRSI